MSGIAYVVGRILNASTTQINSKTSTVSATPIHFDVNYARVVSNVDCWLSYGASPAALTAGQGTFLPAGVVEIFEVSNGEVFVCIADTAATGNLNITQLTE